MSCGLRLFALPSQCLTYSSHVPTAQPSSLSALRLRCAPVNVPSANTRPLPSNKRPDFRQAASVLPPVVTNSVSTARFVFRLGSAYLPLYHPPPTLVKGYTALKVRYKSLRNGNPGLLGHFRFLPIVL